MRQELQRKALKRRHQHRTGPLARIYMLRLTLKPTPGAKAQSDGSAQMPVTSLYWPTPVSI